MIGEQTSATETKQRARNALCFRILAKQLNIELNGLLKTKSS